ncbi:MAG: hypothetical protein RL605_147 [Actinomycetota bacterium]
MCLVTTSITLAGFARAKEIDAVADAARNARFADADTSATAADISMRLDESFAGWPIHPRLMALKVADWQSGGVAIEATFSILGGQDFGVVQEVKAHAASELNEPNQVR